MISDENFFEVICLVLLVDYKFILGIIQIICMASDIWSLQTQIGIQVLLMCILNLVSFCVFYYTVKHNGDEHNILKSLMKGKIRFIVLGLAMTLCHIWIWITYSAGNQLANKGMWLMWVWEFWNFVGALIAICLWSSYKIYKLYQKHIAEQIDVPDDELTNYTPLEMKMKVPSHTKIDSHHKERLITIEV